MGMNNMRIDRDTFEEYLRRLQTTKGEWNKDIQWQSARADEKDMFLYHLMFLNPYAECVDEWNILGDFKSVEKTYVGIQFDPVEIETKHVILAPWGKHYLIHYVSTDSPNKMFLDAYEVVPKTIQKIEYHKCKKG